MTSTTGSEPLVRRVEDVLITAELASRPFRPADYEAESRALGLLAEEMITNPRGVLQKCAELVMELCHADSAGISILEPGGTGMLRWQAAVGRFAPNLHGTMPQEASPCGTVIGRNCVLLFHEAERFFPALRGVEPRIYENLLTPWHVQGKAEGTLWAIKHTPEGRFDAEDARILQSLARYAAAAFQMTSALDEATAERTELEQRTAQLCESEERQAFLLKLADKTREQVDAEGVAATACQLLAERFDASRVQYLAVEGSPGEEVGDAIGEHIRRGRRLPRHFEFADFGEGTVSVLRAGRTLVISDIDSDPRLGPEERKTWHSVDVRASVCAALVKGGRITGTLAVQDGNPRNWTKGDIALVEAVAERTWASLERVRAEQALRESEAKFRTLFDAMDEGFAICELVRDANGRAIDYRYTEVNPAVVRHVGISAEALQGRLASDVFTHLDPWLLETYARVVDEGQSIVTDHHFAHVDRWLHINAFPRGGNFVAVLYSDVSERKRAEQALRDSEERQAFLLRFTDAIRSELNQKALIERAVQMLAEELAVDRAYATRHHPAADLTDVIHEVRRPELTPLPATLRFSDFPEAGRRTFEQTLIFDDTANDQSLTKADKAALASMGVRAFLSRPLRRDGIPIFSLGVVSTLPRRWTPVEVALVEEVTERTWAAAERVHADQALRDSEGRARLLLAELQHRVRNIMAMIRSIARRTGDTAETVDDYAQHLQGRIDAMARTQALLTRDVHTGVDLQNLVLDELLTQAAQPNQYAVTGPNISLPPKAAEVLGLAIHELATNSVKYGALSRQGGHLEVRWTLLDGEQAPQLSLVWAESGVTIDGDPPRQGFGTELITRRVPYELQGTGRIEFRATGLIASLQFPLTDLPSILQTDEGKQAAERALEGRRSRPEGLNGQENF